MNVTFAGIHSQPSGDAPAAGAEPPGAEQYHFAAIR